MSNPFRYFETSPEIMRLVVMMYVHFPLSLRKVEGLLHERDIDITISAVPPRPIQPLCQSLNVAGCSATRLPKQACRKDLRLGAWIFDFQESAAIHIQLPVGFSCCGQERYERSRIGETAGKGEVCIRRCPAPPGGKHGQKLRDQKFAATLTVAVTIDLSAYMGRRPI